MRVFGGTRLEFSRVVLGKRSERSTTTSNLPKTGPEDGLYLAAVLGLLTASATAYVMSKKRNA